MGFREPESTITIRFKADHPYHGLEATVRSISIDVYAEGMGWYGDDSTWSDGQTVDRFYEALVSWNLTDSEDQPIPVTEARGRDQGLIRALNKAWLQVLIGGVHDADPLLDSSTSGENSPAPEIPMAPLSPNPPS